MRVKSCYKLESGLRLGQEGIHACQLGPFSSPVYFTAEEAGNIKISKADIVKKREWIFELLNDPDAETPCKSCDMVVEKNIEDVRFDQLGHIDLAATTTCNLRCDFCGYTHHDSFAPAKYDALEILKNFSKGDVVWKAAVDFNGGEPTILKDFDEHIKYFHERRIRVFLFTNGVVYKQSVADCIENGTIRWCVVSLDAGTTATYNRTKKSTKYEQVLENITKYSASGRKGGGNVAVKYIFTENNCTEDDLLGFVYAMIACRPQEIWLTFDFDPLCNLPADAPNFGGYDYSKHIDAYVRMYDLFRKHGVTPIHYVEKHLAPASLHGKQLLELVKQKLNKQFVADPHLDLVTDKAGVTMNSSVFLKLFKLNQGKIYDKNNNLIEEAAGPIRIAISPATHHVDKLIERLDQKFQIEFLLDKDKVLIGKLVSDIKIYGYEHLPNSQIEYVFVKAPQEILNQIIFEIHRYAPSANILLDAADFSFLKRLTPARVMPLARIN